MFSSIAFLFSKSFLEDKQKEFEEEVLEFNLYEFSKKFEEYNKYSGFVFSQDFLVSSGILVFNSSILEYFPNGKPSSLGEGICFDGVCSRLLNSSNYVNISPFIFSTNIKVVSKSKFSFEIDKENLQILILQIE